MNQNLDTEDKLLTSKATILKSTYLVNNQSNGLVQSSGNTQINGPCV